MPRLIRELYAHPELGFLGHTMALGVIVQYWRSFDDLEAYARNKKHLHLPAWTAFHHRIGFSSGDVGIWHETYRIAPGQYKTLYGSMPVFGLGKVGRLVPVDAQRNSARDRHAHLSTPA